MDHLYYKSHDRFPGFQVITSRCGPDHSYSTSTSSIQTPPKRYSEKRKRGSVTPTGKTPQQLSKKATFKQDMYPGRRKRKPIFKHIQSVREMGFRRPPSERTVLRQWKFYFPESQD
ncbi:hypothetical protein MAR_036856, partial [Mya arenaria]